MPATAAFGLIPGIAKVHGVMLNPVHHVIRPGIVINAAAPAPFIMFYSFALHKQKSCIFTIVQLFPPYPAL